ncbi:MAG: ABC transporter ATP-binding protein [Candidatus Limiplasma sp.]|nr:ABC transporter ATP-binding protein [Candidatus Limiplasma sp.]
MQDVILDIRQLSVAFKYDRKFLPVTHDVSFQVRRGEILGLVGESGSGKSVTSKVVMGLLPRNTSKILSGEALWEGRDVTKLPPKAFYGIRGKQVSMIFQEPMTSLNPVFTCGDQITEAIRLHQPLSKAAAWQAGIDIMAQVGIPMPQVRMKNYPHELSGGMRQRVMIAMALSCNPKLLIADEPTTALDPTIQAQIVELIKELQKKRNMSVLYISHDLGVIAETCHRVVVMYAGSVMEIAPVRELFHHPLHPYTQGLIASIPKTGAREGGRLPSIEGSVPHVTDMPEGCPFHPRCPYAREVCRRALPPLVERDGHSTRCLRVEGGNEAW